MCEARRAIRGFEPMNMLCKGQVVRVKKGDVKACTEFVFQIFGVAALTKCWNYPNWSERLNTLMRGIKSANFNFT